MINFQNTLDSLPIGVLFLTYIISALLVSEVGYRFGHWLQNRTKDEKEGPTAMIVGSLLALLGFLLAITMGMAADRFDRRRSMVLEEANAIGTTYLRAGYLPEPASHEVQDLIRAYVPLRIIQGDPGDLSERIARSSQIQKELWSIAEELARNYPESEVLALFIESLNQTIDLHETRIVAGIYSRVPHTILLLLIAGSLLTLAAMGYNSGLMQRRSSATAVLMIIVLGAVITLVVDIDRPRGGFIIVDQTPLIDLQEQIGTTGPLKTP
jgi:MFS family permease